MMKTIESEINRIIARKEKLLLDRAAGKLNGLKFVDSLIRLSQQQDRLLKKATQTK